MKFHPLFAYKKSSTLHHDTHWARALFLLESTWCVYACKKPPIAQLVEREAYTFVVTGSSPVGRTQFKKILNAVLYEVYLRDSQVHTTRAFPFFILRFASLKNWSVLLGGTDLKIST